MCTHKYIYTHVFRDVTYNILLHPIFLSKHQHVLHRKPAAVCPRRRGKHQDMGSLQPEDSTHVPGHQSLRHTGCEDGTTMAPLTLKPKKKKSSESRFMGLEERNYRKPRGHAMLSGGLERSAKASPAPWKSFNGNQFHLMGFQSLPYELMSSDTAMLRVPSWAGQQQCTQLRGSLGHPGMQ